MPRADSGGPIVYELFTANTRADFVSAVRTHLLAAGWVQLSTPSGGYILRGTSPQSTGPEVLTVRVKVADTGHTSIFSQPQATIQIISDVTPNTVVSNEHYVHCFPGAIYRIWANPCQALIWRPGVAHDQEGSTICLSVPRTASAAACHDVAPAEVATEAWWIVSDIGGSARAHPRITLAADGPTHGAAAPNYADACWNGSFHDRNTSVAGWQILPIHSLKNFGFFSTFGLTLSHTRWWDGQGLTYEPLLSWGKAAATLGQIRAQLWDSWVYSLPQTMDTLVTDSRGDVYVNFTDEYYWGCLRLLIAQSTEIGNVAY